MNQADTNPLVTRPLDELAGGYWKYDDPAMPGFSWLDARNDLAVSVGSLNTGHVILSLATGHESLAEVRLTPKGALELASRLLRMAAAVHQAVNERSNP